MKLISKRGREAADALSHKERLEEVRRCELDPVYFINNYFKISFGSSMVQLTLAKHQEEYVRALQNNHHTIALMARCQGLTTVTLAFLMWESLFSFHRTSMVTSHHLSHVADQQKIVADAAKALPDFWKALKRCNKQSIEFCTGSVIKFVAMTPTAGRGMAINRLFADNFSKATSKVQDEFFVSIYPCLATGGQAIFAGSPSGTNNQFHELYKLTQDKITSNFWTLFKKTVHDIGMSATTMSAIKLTLSEKKWQEEMLCEFVED